MRPISPGIVAVFDFDLTITSWDTATRFFVWLIRRSPWKLTVALLTLPLLGPLFAFVRTRKMPSRFGAWLATVGFTHDRLASLAELHVEHVGASGERFVRQDAMARLQYHLALGHDVVVATGCLEVLARVILVAEGLGDIVVIGTTVQRYCGGMVAKEHCVGDRKVAMLADRGYVDAWDYAYSDHPSDLPMLRKGKRRFIVNPSSRNAPIMLAMLGASATVLSWT